jgi:hypothetical protein
MKIATRAIAPTLGLLWMMAIGCRESPDRPAPANVASTPLASVRATPDPTAVPSGRLPGSP